VSQIQHRNDSPSLTSTNFITLPLERHCWLYLSYCTVYAWLKYSIRVLKTLFFILKLQIIIDIICTHPVFRIFV